MPESYALQVTCCTVRDKTNEGRKVLGNTSKICDYKMFATFLNPGSSFTKKGEFTSVGVLQREPLPLSLATLRKPPASLGEPLVCSIMSSDLLLCGLRG